MAETIGISLLWNLKVTANSSIFLANVQTQTPPNLFSMFSMRARNEGIFMDFHVSLVQHLICNSATQETIFLDINGS